MDNSASTSEEQVYTAADLAITITESAQAYLLGLLKKQKKGQTNVRIFVERPGTPYAECCMSYCATDEQEAGDVEYPCEGFIAYIEAKSVPYLEDAKIDYAKERMGGQLTFRAPKSKVPQIGEGASLEEKINHILFSEVNPSLAAHGGQVSLLRLEDEGTTAVLKFGGGCQGCSAVDITLKQGIEKTLMTQLPEISTVKDETDHSVTENAYY